MRRLTLLAALLATVVLSSPSPATIGVFVPLEQKLLLADFVGVVECQTAGGIVAKYRVVESLRGPKVGTELTIAQDINFHAEQYPLALCKERYLIAGWKDGGHDPGMISSSEGPLPLKWRRIPVDFHVPLFSGLHQQLPQGYEKDPKIKSELEFARRIVRDSSAEQELVLLRGLISGIKPPERVYGEPAVRTRKRGDCERLFGLPTVAAVKEELTRLEKQDQANWSADARRIIDEFAGIIQRLEAMKKQIARSAEKAITVKPASQPGPERLARSLSILLEKEGPSDGNFGEAFFELTRHDPGSVAAFLRNGSFRQLPETINPRERLEKERSYLFGSLFCVDCSGSRVQHLTSLLGSHDDFVRVAGAVYLCYEDEARGVAELKRLLALPEEAGAWAALTLARRGHKDAMPRLLEYYLRKRETVLYLSKEASLINLAPRIIELLSNSASASGLQHPPEQRPENEAQQFAEPQADRLALRDWWRQYEGRITLHDPWLDLLAKQKVD